MNQIYIDWGFGLGNEVYSCLDIGKKLLKKLEQNGIEAVMGHKNGKVIRLEQRIEMIKNSDADILISIDANWSDNSNQKGIETYYNTLSKDAELLAKKIQRELIKATKFYNRGIINCSSKTNLTIRKLIESKDTSIIVLLGFYSNPHEKTEMNKNIFREQVANSILNSLKEFLKIKGNFM